MIRGRKVKCQSAFCDVGEEGEKAVKGSPCRQSIYNKKCLDTSCRAYGREMGKNRHPARKGRVPVFSRVPVFYDTCNVFFRLTADTGRSGGEGGRAAFTLLFTLKQGYTG